MWVARITGNVDGGIVWFSLVAVEHVTPLNEDGGIDSAEK